MASFVVEGGVALKGSIAAQGAKNAALPLIAAAVLTSETCTLHHVPRIADVMVLLEIMSQMGAHINWVSKNTLQINCANLTPDKADPLLVRRLRASVLLIGPLMTRFNRMTMPYPGGCVLGKRSLDTHFEGFRALGAEVLESETEFMVSHPPIKQGRIVLAEASVTATENLMMAAARATDEVEIRYAACEPHVTNLGRALVQMGVTIEGLGSHHLKLRGTDSLGGYDIRVIPDQLEIGSFAVLAAATGSDLVISGVEQDLLDPILLKLGEAGVVFDLSGDRLHIHPSHELRAFKLTTNIWPGFPTDLQAPFTVLATQCRGNSMIHEWMYEGRLFYIDKLIKMGAEIVMCDPHRITVSGPTRLRGKEIDSPDIRAGMALLIAALSATGTSVIDHAEIIDRGYLELEKRLQVLGAHISRK